MKNLSIFKAVIILATLLLSTFCFAQDRLVIPSGNQDKDVFIELDVNFLDTGYKHLETMDGGGAFFGANITEKVGMFVGYNVLSGTFNDHSICAKESAKRTSKLLGIGMNHKINPSLNFGTYLVSKHGKSRYALEQEYEDEESNLRQDIERKYKSDFYSIGTQFNLLYQKGKLGLGLATSAEYQKFYNDEFHYTIDTDNTSASQQFYLNFNAELAREGYYDDQLSQEEIQDIIDKADNIIDQGFWEETKPFEKDYAFNYSVQPKISYGDTFSFFIQPGLNISTAENIVIEGENVSAGLSLQF